MSSCCRAAHTPQLPDPPPAVRSPGLPGSTVPCSRIRVLTFPSNAQPRQLQPDVPAAHPQHTHTHTHTQTHTLRWDLPEPHSSGLKPLAQISESSPISSPSCPALKAAPWPVPGDPRGRSGKCLGPQGHTQPSSSSEDWSKVCSQKT